MPFIYQRTSGVPYHINDAGVSRLVYLQLVGHYVASFGGLCGLGPSADEVPGEQTLLHRKKLHSCAAAAAVVVFASLSYYCYCCSCSFSANRRESTSSSALSNDQVTCRRRVVVASLLRLMVTTLGSISTDQISLSTSESVHHERIGEIIVVLLNIQQQLCDFCNHIFSTYTLHSEEPVSYTIVFSTTVRMLTTHRARARLGVRPILMQLELQSVEKVRFSKFA